MMARGVPMHLVYSALLFVYFLTALPSTAYGVWRRGKAVGSLPERIGRLPVAVNPDRRPSIWVHAVSVGEALAARPLLQALRSAYPEHRLIMSTTTATGQRVARGFDGEVDAVCYAPFDFPPFVNHALDRIAPELLLVVDTEIWPNLLRACRRRGVGTAIVNGRLSDRSFRRYRLVRRCMRRVLADVGHVCAQTDEWARRFVAIGAESARVTVTGSLKFDAVAGSSPGPGADGAEGVGGPRAVFAFARNRPVVIAASTLRGEEQPVLRAFARVRQVASDALLVIAPRHPERFEEARVLAERAGYRVAMRSDLDPGRDPGTDVVILNTLGELGRLFDIASAVFVGGSLVPAGGHNLIEPAASGRAIVVGPHMENFADVAREFVSRGAAIQVRDADALEEVLAALMRDGARRGRLGRAARAIVDANRGATRRTLDRVADLLPSAVGARMRPAGGARADGAAAC
jgi:3-deoxy-D-manno-octulosonic-acid transferase